MTQSHSIKILHVAYGLVESSAATRLAMHQNKIHQVRFFLGRLSKCGFIRERQVYPYTLVFLGISFHLYEMLMSRLFGVINGEMFSFGLTSALQRMILRRAVSRFKFDVVHLHWGGYGFCPVSALKGISAIKVVTAHDYHCFTGGCHVPMGCEQLHKSCADCPLLGNEFLRPLASYSLRERISCLQNLNPKFTAPSTYTRNVISSVLEGADIRVIPNVLGVQYPTDPGAVDAMLGLYRNRESYDCINLLVVGVAKSMRDNKGARVLDYVVERLKKQNIRFKVMVVGAWMNDCDPSIYVNYGNLESSELAHVYAVADLCLVPSRYETFSQVTLESIACCTPVVAFDLTGPKDIIVEGRSGFLVPSFDVEAYYLAVMDNLHYKRANLATLGECALNAIDRHSGQAVVNAFDELYDVPV